MPLLLLVEGDVELDELGRAKVDRERPLAVEELLQRVRGLNLERQLLVRRALLDVGLGFVLQILVLALLDWAQLHALGKNALCGRLRKRGHLQRLRESLPHVKWDVTAQRRRRARS